MMLSKEEFRGICLDANRESSEKSENPFFQTDSNLPAYIGKYGFRRLEATTYFINLDVGKYSFKKLLKPTSFIKEGIKKLHTIYCFFFKKYFDNSC